MKSILIVEDLPTLRLGLTTQLSLSGVRVETAADAEQARHRLATSWIAKPAAPATLLTTIHRVGQGP